MNTATCLLSTPVDAELRPDPTWTGFMGFSSSDPLAQLPPPIAFPGPDPNFAGLAFVTFRTPGRQTVTVSDIAGALTPATISILVLAPEAIPDIEPFGRGLLAASLAAAAVTLLGRRVHP